MKAVLIDDEALAIEVLADSLSSFEEIEIVGKYTDPVKALKDLKKTRPDIIFLDIEMGEYNGILMANEILDQWQAEIVFVTAYSEYAIEAFELNALDYVLKPVQKTRMKKTIERLKRQATEKDPGPAKSQLRISSFGNFVVSNQEGQKLGWRTQKSKELFIYLWLHEGGQVAKDKILEDIFEYKDLEKASAILHTTIYQIRKNLQKLGIENPIHYQNESYYMAIESQSDLDQVRAILGQRERSEKEIRDLLALYQGSFCQSESYSWLINDQYAYEKKIQKALQDFAYQEIAKDEAKDLIGAILDKLNAVDPYNEEIIRALMKYYGKEKNRGKVKEIFTKSKKAFKADLDQKLEMETLQIYSQYK